MPSDESLGGEPTDITLATYDQAAQVYVERSRAESPDRDAFLARVAAMVRGGDVLELGSGPGWDADFLEAAGVRVHRSDATPAFVVRLRAAGHEARLLDARSDDFGGPYRGVVAMATLLHLSREQFAAALRKARRAVSDDGVLAFTLKEGDGEAWSSAKLALPRHFTFWREDAIRASLAESGWMVESLDHVVGRTEDWLFVIARAAQQDPRVVR